MGDGMAVWVGFAGCNIGVGVCSFGSWRFCYGFGMDNLSTIPFLWMAGSMCT